MILTLLDVFTFRTNQPEFNELLNAIKVIKEHKETGDRYYPNANLVPLNEVVPTEWLSMVKDENNKIDRMNYEVSVLEELRRQLRCKSIWIEGAYRYRNPDEDTPKDFNDKRDHYYEMLNLPLNPDDFINSLKTSLDQHLQELNENIPTNDKVKILDKDGGRIKLSPSEPQAEPVNMKSLHQEINRRRSTISLIDILKEADLRINFSAQFHTVGSRDADLRYIAKPHY